MICHCHGTPIAAHDWQDILARKRAYYRLVPASAVRCLANHPDSRHHVAAPATDCRPTRGAAIAPPRDDPSRPPAERGAATAPPDPANDPGVGSTRHPSSPLLETCIIDY